MVIAETFASLQGEGTLVGTPSFFIRTAGCNLRCAWCDTPYASWAPEGRRVAPVTLVERATSAGLHHVVITGGEPLLQREIGELTRMLSATGHHLTVETAGTLAPTFSCDLLSVSPKTGNSDPDGVWRARHRTARSGFGVLATLLERHPEYQLKFVVRGREDLAEVEEIVAQVRASRGRVLLMPEGRSAEEVAGRRSEVARLCLEHGFRYSARLHLDLFGGGRGV
ncbi:MAG: 7-carboxy-7-deazaguanine synthase QueE [Acidobacteriota bacterium]